MVRGTAFAWRRRHGLRPGHQERHGGGWFRLAGGSGGRGYRRGADRRHRRGERSGEGNAGRGRPRRRAGLRRWPYAHGRAGVLGSHRLVFLLPRRHQRGDGQLRLHPSALPRRGSGPRVPQSRTRRGHRPGSDAGRHPVALGKLPRIPGRARRNAEGHQLRGLSRPLGAAHLRDGGAGVRGRGHRRRGSAHGGAGGTGCSRRGDGFHHLAFAEPPDLGSQAGGEPRGGLGRSARHRRRDGPGWRWHVRDRGRSRGPRSGAHRGLPPALEGVGGGDRGAGHLGIVRQPSGAGNLAAVPGPARRRGSGWRAHVRAGSFAGAERHLHLPLAHAVRFVGRVARRPQAVAGRAAGEVRRPRTAGQAGSRCQPSQRTPQGAGRHRQSAGLGVGVRHARYAWQGSERGGDGTGTRGRASAAGHRPGIGRGLRDAVPHADQQRERRRRAGDDEASALGGDVLGLRRPRFADHGQFAANQRLQPVGARARSADAGRGGAHGDRRTRQPLGAARTRPVAPGLGGGRDGIRPERDSSRHAGDRPRPAGRRQALQADRDGHSRHGGERRGAAQGQRTDRGGTGEAAAGGRWRTGRRAAHPLGVRASSLRNSVGRRSDCAVFASLRTKACRACPMVYDNLECRP